MLMMSWSGRKQFGTVVHHRLALGPRLTVRFTFHFAIRPHGLDGFARRYGLAAGTVKSLPDS